jgi:tetraacyldisaccharide 4'-kinase
LCPPTGSASLCANLQLRTGLKPIRRLRWPVISIGNLSTGGTGKTPLTIALAKALTGRGLHVGVLSRGYGRRSALALLVDPSGDSAEDFGDEPLVIAREAQVPVFLAAERYEAGLLAERSSPSSLGVHLLDDGFQHRQLARDVDILLLSGRDLADHLLPAGNLREPLSAAERAHVIAIPADEPGVEKEIKSRGWKAQIWRVRRQMEVPSVESPIAAFCGIARPDQFFQGLESAGVKLAARTLPSPTTTITPLPTSLASNPKLVPPEPKSLLTTEKDRIRLGSLAQALPADHIAVKPSNCGLKLKTRVPPLDWMTGCNCQLGWKDPA